MKHKGRIWERITIHLKKKYKAFGTEMSSAKILSSHYAAHTVTASTSISSWLHQRLNQVSPLKKNLADEQSFFSIASITLE